MEKPYKTILEPAEDEFVEKKSRFIAYTSPVHTVEEANAFIAGIRQRHWDATHNVPAFVLRSGVQRSSDDGEPGGTAGIPVLDVLLKSGVQDVCVVVTRYFGGVLLGAGGLVRAYSHACSLALEAAGVVTMAPCAAMELTAPGLCGGFDGAVRRQVCANADRQSVCPCIKIPKPANTLFERQVFLYEKTILIFRIISLFLLVCRLLCPAGGDR